MKKGPKIVWTAPPEKINSDRQKKQEIKNLPPFHAEPNMDAAARVTWDSVEVGTAVRLLVDLDVNNYRTGVWFPYDRFVVELTTRPRFPAGTFAIYMGMVPVKMRHNRSLVAVTRNYRVLLVGGEKFILDNPNYVAAA